MMAMIGTICLPAKNSIGRCQIYFRITFVPPSTIEGITDGIYIMLAAGGKFPKEQFPIRSETPTRSTTASPRIPYDHIILARGSISHP
jgi:hypothetical protein